MRINMDIHTILEIALAVFGGFLSIIKAIEKVLDFNKRDKPIKATKKERKVIKINKKLDKITKKITKQKLDIDQETELKPTIIGNTNGLPHYDPTFTFDRDKTKGEN